ncbi:MAG: YIP1 family protein [Syntrophaceticus sp.]
MISLIFKPVPFLEEKLNTTFSITKPLVIIVSKTLLQNLSLLYLMFYIIKFFGSEGNILLVFFIIFFIMTLLLNITVWFASSGIAYILISKTTKDIKFNKIFELMGYGFMPFMIGALISSIYNMYLISQVNFEAVSLKLMPDLLAQTLIFSDWFTICEVIFILWGGYIWFNIFKMYNIKKPLLVISTPLAIMVIIKIFS